MESHSWLGICKCSVPTSWAGITVSSLHFFLKCASPTRKLNCPPTYSRLRLPHLSPPLLGPGLPPSPNFSLFSLHTQLTTSVAFFISFLHLMLLTSCWNNYSPLLALPICPLPAAFLLSLTPPEDFYEQLFFPLSTCRFHLQPLALLCNSLHSFRATSLIISPVQLRRSAQGTWKTDLRYPCIPTLSY